MKKRIAIQLSSADIKILEEVSEESGRTKNNLIELIVREFIEREKKTRLNHAH